MYMINQPAGLASTVLVLFLSLWGSPALSGGIFCDRFESGICPVAPFITSADTHVCQVAEPCSFTFTASGSPSPAFSLDPVLPAGLEFNQSQAAISGIPESGTGGVHEFSLKAFNGVDPEAFQQFELTILEATGLTFDQQPSAALINAVIDPPVTVRIEDQFGNVMSDATHEISLSLANNPAGATLGGSTSVIAINGVATFDDLSVDQVGTGYTLRATATGLTSTSSDAFDITVGEAAKLQFEQQPTPTAADETIHPAVTVRVLDTQGNLVTDSTNEVSIGLGSHPGNGVLSGTLSVNPEQGIALFSDLSIREPGSGYTLVASATGLAEATSDVFDITAPPSISVGNIELQTFSSADLAIHLDQAAGPGGQSVSLVSSNPAAVSVPAALLVLEGSTSADATVQSGATSGTVTITASSEGFSDGDGLVTVVPRSMRLDFDPLIGVGRTNNGLVILDEPAPEQGVNVALVSSNASIVSVTPAGGFIANGQTEAEFELRGEAEGVVVITATAPGYQAASAQAGGTNVTVSIGTIPALAPGESRSLPISLSEPAPPEGLSIVLESEDPGVASVVESVFIAGGSQVPAANPQVTGVSVGTTVIRAGAEGFAPDARVATVQERVSTRLAFSQQPTSTVANETIQPAVTVRIEDEFGNLVNTTAAVTLAIASDPTNQATISGTLTVEAAGGLAVFADLSIDRVAEGYTLEAVATELTSAISDPFSITTAAPAQLAFGQQPTTTAEGAVMDPAVTVRVLDTGGNLVTDSTNEVSIGLGSNPADGSLAGTLSVLPEEGIAVFADLSIDQAGAGYTLAASAAGLAGATSEGFDVTALPSISVGAVTLTTFSSANLPIQLDQVAGPGGQTVALVSSDPAVVSVPPSVLVAEGSTHVDAVVQTENSSTIVTVSASSDGFSDGAGLVTVVPRTMTLAFDPLVGVGRTNDGLLVLDEPAPEGGVSVALGSSNSMIVSVFPSSVVISEGQSEADFTLTGEAEGVVVITATAIGYEDASAQAGGTNSTVSIGTIPVLAPGESRSLPISLSSPAPPEGLTILLASEDSGIATVAESVFIAAGSQVPAANPQVTGVAAGTTVIRAGAAGFAPDARVATVQALSMAISPNPISIFQGFDRTVTISISRAAPAGGLAISLTSLDDSIFTVPASEVIPEGQSSITILAEGIAEGTSSLLVESPAATSATAAVSVRLPPDTILFSTSSVVVGKDLQQQASVRLEELPLEPVDITVTIASGSTALLSASRTEVGTTSITFTAVANTNSQIFYVQGLELGSTTITAQAAGYNDRQTSVTVRPSGFHLASSDFSTTTFSANRNITIQSFRLTDSGAITNFSSDRQEIRAGLTVPVPVTSSQPAVGSITISPVNFAGGTGSERNTQFNPLTAGQTTVFITQPDGFTTPTTNGRTSLLATVTDG